MSWCWLMAGRQQAPAGSSASPLRGGRLGFAPVSRPAHPPSHLRLTRCTPTSIPPLFLQGLSSNARYQVVFGLERIVDEVGGLAGGLVPARWRAWLLGNCGWRRAHRALMSRCSSRQAAASVQPQARQLTAAFVPPSCPPHSHTPTDHRAQHPCHRLLLHPGHPLCQQRGGRGELYRHGALGGRAVVQLLEQLGGRAVVAAVEQLGGRAAGAQQGLLEPAEQAVPAGLAGCRQSSRAGTGLIGKQQHGGSGSNAACPQRRFWSGAAHSSSSKLSIYRRGFFSGGGWPACQPHGPANSLPTHTFHVPPPCTCCVLYFTFSRDCQAERSARQWKAWRGRKTQTGWEPCRR